MLSTGRGRGRGLVMGNGEEDGSKPRKEKTKQAKQQFYTCSLYRFLSGVVFPKCKTLVFFSLWFLLQQD